MKKQLVVHGIDIGGKELDEWSPANEIDFECDITIEVGLDGDDGTMLFYLKVSSIERIQSIQSNCFLSKRLIVRKYNSKIIFEYITNIMNLNNFSSWDDAKEYLDYHFSNEYFNYNNKHFYLK